MQALGGEPSEIRWLESWGHVTWGARSISPRMEHRWHLTGCDSRWACGEAQLGKQGMKTQPDLLGVRCYVG